MRKRLLELVQYLESGLIERALPARLSLLAALSGEHLLLLGPPGTAKSELARKLHRVFSGANYFERLLTRFSVPEELFGPLSIKALEDDRYQRLTKGYLPDASVAFIDEIFKSNSAILNSLLTLLNEREFDNGSERVSVPLVCVVAASNEMPEEAGLEALYDRFLIRYKVSPVSDKGFESLLKLSLNQSAQLPVQSAGEMQQHKPEKSPEKSPGKPPEQPAAALSIDDIVNIQQLSSAVVLDEKSRLMMQDLRRYLQDQSIYISDRRWRQTVKMLQVCAFTSEQKSITVWDCTLMLHIMWQLPEQQSDLKSWFVNALNLDVESAELRIHKLVLTWESQLEEDRNKVVQKTNAQGEPLYVDPAGQFTTQHEHVSFAQRQGAALYLSPPDQLDRTNQNKGYTLKELESTFFDKRYKQTHIEGRWIDVQNYINNTQNKLIERRLFEPVVEAFYFPLEDVVNQLREIEKAIDDVKLVCDGFEAIMHELDTVLEKNIWLSYGVLRDAYETITKKIPSLIDFQQRLIKLKEINAHLSVQ